MSENQTSPLGVTEASEIAKFFDEMSLERNQKIRSNLIINYEQQVRSATVLAMLSPQPGEKILDIGCGNARDLAIIAKTDARVVGVDISQGMIDQARQELGQLSIHNVELEVGDATQLRFAEGAFDKVLCSEVIEHIPDAEKALQEMWRVLKPGGLLVMSTPNPNSWYGFDRYWLWERVLRRKWDHPYDQWRSMSQLVALEEDKGFKVVNRIGACYVPGFLGTYFYTPRILQKMLLGVVRRVESSAAKHLPQLGYMVCTAAIKQVS